MANSNQPALSLDHHDLPPGTIRIIKEDGVTRPTESGHPIILSPMPSKNPNDPLNWSKARKSINFGLVLAVTCLIFTALSIQAIFWQLMVIDLNVTYEELNRAMSVNFVGLSMGCVFFIPLAKKFGRRPVYLVSTALMLITSFWTSELNSLTELYLTNLFQGLAGATNEAIVQVTIADLFFVHHRGSMNALYMSMMMIGSFLTPMAAGTQATRQSWRWSYRTLGICNAVCFILFLFFYEETKYVKDNRSLLVNGPDTERAADSGVNKLDGDAAYHFESADADAASSQVVSGDHEIDTSIPMAKWSSRLAFYTYTDESIWPHYYRPFVILASFPAVICCALQYACGVIWLTIMSSVLAIVFPQPPYLFTPEQAGFMGVGPFIGNLIGSLYGGFLGDKAILYYSRRNKGFYEPEMRLYILHVPAVAMCAGLIMFGVTIDRGLHWIWPSVAGALFGFGLGSISDACLTLVIDSYVDITGDAFTGVAFIRNAFSIGIPFAITPWMDSNGLSNMFIACGFISLGVTLTMVPMVYYGKRLRRLTANHYRHMASSSS